MKKVQDYAVGEHVWEDTYHAGRVAAFALHPRRPSMAYLLVVNSHNEYTIYKGLTDANCALGLARNIPESVATHFSQVIQKGEALPLSEPPNGRKYPVVTKPEAAKPEPESEEPKADAGAPYFDFV